MIILRFLLMTALALAPLPAAAERGLALSDILRVSVRPGWRTDDGRHVAALSLRLAPGWKTYWRAPGPLGIPPEMDWSRSRNLAESSVAWPRPQVIAQAGGHALGYAGDVVVPLVLRARSGGAPIRLRGRLSLGVCAEVCVPVELPVDAVLPAAGAVDPAIRAALARAPAPLPGVARCRTAPSEDGLALEVTVEVPPTGGTEAVAVELPDPALWVTEAVTRREGGTLRARVGVMGRGAVSIDRSAVRITVVGRDRAYETLGCRGG